ncbi:hypothetical protein Tco_0453993 [Tanacetum coccineum]
MTLQNQNHEIAQMYHYLSDKYKDNGRFRGLKSGCNESDVKPSWKDIKKAKACMLAKAQTSKASSKAKLEACGSKAKVEAYYALWEVTVNGDSPLPKRTVDGVEQTYPLITAKGEVSKEE